MQFLDSRRGEDSGSSYSAGGEDDASPAPPRRSAAPSGDVRMTNGPSRNAYSPSGDPDSAPHRPAAPPTPVEDAEDDIPF